MDRISHGSWSFLILSTMDMSLPLLLFPAIIRDWLGRRRRLSGGYRLFPKKRLMDRGIDGKRLTSNNLWITFKIICLIQRLKEVRKEKEKCSWTGNPSLPQGLGEGFTVTRCLILTLRSLTVCESDSTADRESLSQPLPYPGAYDSSFCRDEFNAPG